MIKDKALSKKACVLVSGGVESAVLLNDSLGRYEEVTPIYIQNHLRWEETEIFYLKNFIRHLRQSHLKSLKILDLNLRDLYESHWSITGIKIPDGKSPDRSVYLPGRNILFLSKAAVFASMNNISTIEIGVLSGNPFADSTKDFFKKMSQLVSIGLSCHIDIVAPFQKLKKEQVLGMAKGLPLEMTFSCINPKGFEHCGDCNKCVERKKAFFAAGIFDKTRYKKSGL